MALGGARADVRVHDVASAAEAEEVAGAASGSPATPRDYVVGTTLCSRGDMTLFGFRR
jgi:hypothetical protein